MGQAGVRAVMILMFFLFPSLCWAQIQQAWVATYNNGLTNGTHQAVLMKLDAAGNIIVTGLSQNTNNNLDYVTIKYAPNGTQLWVARYDSGGDDQPRGLVVDNTGNVYVTGTSVTVKYNSSGAQIWTAPYPGRGLAVDTNGTLYVTGFLTNAFSTVKLDSAGSNQWVRTTNFLDNTPNRDTSQAVAVDAVGNIYVSGQATCAAFHNSSDVNFSLVKYDTNGNQMWVARPWECDSIVQANVKGLVVDATTGDVTMTGNLVGLGVDFATVRYTSDGIYKWRYFRAATGSDDCTGMSLDAQGRVYLSGGLANVSFGVYLNIKVNATGTQEWIRQYPSGFNEGRNFGNAVGQDAIGNAYVSGFSALGGLGSPTDATTIKYDSNGNQVCVLRYDGPAHSNDAANAIAVDGQGSVYVAGYQTVPGGGTEMILIKYATLQNIALESNGTANLQWCGNVGQSYRIQASTTLTNWTDLGTVQANSTNIYSFTDTNAPLYPYRFYRSVSP